MGIDDQIRERQELSEAARRMGVQGGKARRPITSEQARAMARARWDRRAARDRLYRVDDDQTAVTGRLLLNANDNDPGLAALLATLGIGQSMIYGGGAGAEFTIARIG